MEINEIFISYCPQVHTNMEFQDNTELWQCDAWFFINYYYDLMFTYVINEALFGTIGLFHQSAWISLTVLKNIKITS